MRRGEENVVYLEYGMMNQELAWNHVVMRKAVVILAISIGQSKDRDEATAMTVRQTPYKENGTI